MTEIPPLHSPKIPPPTKLPKVDRLNAMLVVSISKAGAKAVRANARVFSAMVSGQKPAHASKEFPPSERKIKRNNEKKAREEQIAYYKKLDEEAAKAGLETPWKYRLSL